MNKTLIPLLLAALLPLATTGCETHILPLRPLQQVETWVPDEPTTQPATQGTPDSVAAAPSAATAPADASTTQPAGGHFVTKTVDPNQASRFIYNASYDNLWQQSMTLLHEAGFAVDRHDYRLGVLSSAPLASAQIIEFWKPQHSNPHNALENTINSQRRSVTITISPVPDKPEFYQIALQVIVERQTNPSEEIGGPLFVEGSGFGRNVVTLRSDYAPLKPEAGTWVTLGHDPDLEKKLLDALFLHI